MSTQRPVCARDLMNVHIFSVNENSSISFTELASEAWNVRHIPVVGEDDRLVGMVSHRDLLSYFADRENNENLSICTIMKKKVVTVPPDATLSELAHIMLDFEISALPVVEKGKMIGMVSERDFLKLYS